MHIFNIICRALFIAQYLLEQWITILYIIYLSQCFLLYKILFMIIFLPSTHIDQFAICSWLAIHEYQVSMILMRCRYIQHSVELKVPQRIMLPEALSEAFQTYWNGVRIKNTLQCRRRLKQRRSGSENANIFNGILNKVLRNVTNFYRILNYLIIILIEYDAIYSLDTRLCSENYIHFINFNTISLFTYWRNGKKIIN